MMIFHEGASKNDYQHQKILKRYYFFSNLSKKFPEILNFKKKIFKMFLKLKDIFQKNLKKGFRLKSMNFSNNNKFKINSI